MARCRSGTPERRDAIAGGDALRCAARVEPLFGPGQIWTTEEFRHELVRRPLLRCAMPVHGRDGAERVAVRKGGRSEPDLWVRPFRLEF